MSSVHPMMHRPDGVLLAATWFLVVAAAALFGIAAILVFAYPAVLAQTATGVDRYLAIGGVSLGLLVVAALGAANTAGAVGLLRLRPWARISAIALAAISFLIFPIGTIAGGLIIGYMLTDEAKAAFGRLQRAVSTRRVTIDLREQPRQSRPFSTTTVPRISRYKSRSANLPHMGEDATSVLRSLESLRP
jgi:hypothetical protein